jgi:hypothetical protein
VQAPQSAAQEVHVSACACENGLDASWRAHVRSPHTGQAPQSPGQLVQLSAGVVHTPSPQLQAPQSAGQLVQVSASPALHVPSPQLFAHAPQSAAHVVQVSPSASVHVPSPQLGPVSQ